MKILIMNGAAESGKGTVAELIQKNFNFKVVSYSSIDYVKKVAREQFGWDGVKDAKGRKLLSKIKQLMIAYNNLPWQKVVTAIEYAEIFAADLMVVDIREPDEIDKLAKYCELSKITCHTCLVKNSKAAEEAESKGLDKIGDLSYGKYDYDITIDNNKTKTELENVVCAIFSEAYEIENPKPVKVTV